MRYTDQKQFVYEPEIFALSDTQTALRIHDEYVRKHSAKPLPRFFEVDRAATVIDPVFHAPLANRTKFTARSVPDGIQVPAIVQFVKPSWTMTKVGLVPVKQFKFWLSNLGLQALDYFPTRGDLIGYNGYRLFITACVPDPNAYWQQTGVWLGITADAQIYPEGDASPLTDVNVAVPAEKTSSAAPKFSPSIPVGPIPQV